MPLQKQYWEMIFGQSGRVKRTDEKVLESPALSELSNGEIVSPGKIQKRHGYLSLEDSPDSDYDLSVGTRAKRGGALVSIGDYNVTEYNDATEWINDATSLLAASEARYLISTQKFTWSHVDVMCYGGYYYIAATRNLGSEKLAFLFIFDSNFSLVNKTLVVPGSTTVYYAKVHLVPTSSPPSQNVAVFFRNESNYILYMKFINQSTYQLGSALSLATDCNTTYPFFDITSTYIYTYIAYNNDNPGVTVLKVNESGTVVDSDDYNALGVADECLAIRANELNAYPDFSIMLAFCNTSNGVRYVIYDEDLTIGYSNAITSPVIGSLTSVDNIVIGTWISKTKYVVVVQLTASPVTESMLLTFYVNNGVVTAAGIAIGVGIIHKAVGYATSDDIEAPFFGLCRDQDYYCVYYTVQVKSDYESTPLPIRLEPVAKYFYRMGSGIGGSASPESFVSNCVVGTDSKTYHYAAVDIDGKIVLCTFSFDDSGDTFQKRLHSVPVGNDIAIAGSVPLLWDGQVAREIGFTYPPIIRDASTASGGSIADGDYSYIAVYKVIDNSGRVYRSQISEPFDVTVTGLSGAGMVTIQIRPSVYRPDWDSEEDEDRLPTFELYRTEEGPGSVYYKVAEISASDEHAWFSDSYDYSSPEIDDTLADASITSLETLYTTGGLLERCAPPPLDDIALYDNRLWGIDSETGNIVYSAEIVEAEGPWFNQAYVVTSLADIGKPIRIIDTQSFLMVFYKDNIGAIYGQGFNDLGVDGNLTYPKIIVNNLGCSEPKSIAKTPAGIIFKAESGFHIIGYDGSPPQYIGAGVSDYDDYEVVSADVIEDKKHARFVLATSTKPILIYNYEFNQWYVWSYNIDGTWVEKTGGAVIDNVHYLAIGNTGNTFKQGNGYKDGYFSGTYTTGAYDFSITTPWIKLAGLQGFQRVLKAWILGTFESDHDMVVEIDYDYNETNTQTVTITDLSSEIGEDLYQVRIGIVRQRCEAIRFKITIDTSAYSDGAGATLTGLRFEYMAKRGGMRAPNFG